METIIKINSDSLNEGFLEGIKKLFPHQTIEIIIQPADTTEYILSNPAYAKELEERIRAYESGSKTIEVNPNELK